MTTRRSFLQAAGATIPATLWPGASWAAGSGRVALVIGNAAYPQSPLTNPVNDATAMAALFEAAGITVETLTNAPRAEMIAAIGRFVAIARRPETRQVFFYYAGHGVQLDWRNYLLAVDSDVNATDQIPTRCVDLGLLLEGLGKLRDKTLVVILDACRNEPFGTAYKPEQRGLSQFDAPVGTLLAYATSPGSGAEDGRGKHGLYTEHLVRELSVRGTKIEDALKRVRLAVRLGSKGQQVPWESTSLEGDLSLFEGDAKPRSQAEKVKEIEADIAAWEAIKASRNADDWIGYLRRFPNGRFAEIAQMRLVPAAPTPAPLPAPLPSSPHSAGYYPLGRRYAVGNRAVYQVFDGYTGAPRNRFVLRVTKVDEAADRVEINEGAQVWDTMGNALKTAKSDFFDTPRQFTPSELFVGKKWSALFRVQGARAGAPVQLVAFDFRIRARERVVVPAGEFNAFRIEGMGHVVDVESGRLGPSHSASFEDTQWLAPGVNFLVRFERIARSPAPQSSITEWIRRDLVALVQP